ncbi:alpha/beta fold hydrolase [Agromyces sp. MMS24-K17]|uniref:alpha/beta fold hydrolase n=1 Tax=Agromyces sp. MMS24-K17 TaxID=3372850 RepID=UPI0037551C7A
MDRKGDESMHVSETGSGRPLLLLHGAGVAGWMWRPTLERLDGGFRVIVPDLPGFGRSSAETYPTHRAVVDELAGILRDLAPHGALVAGFSLGAQLAIALAAAEPDLVTGAVIVSAEARPARFRRTTLAMLSAAAPLARRPSFARVQARELSIPSELIDDYVRDSAATSRRTLLASVGENLAFRLPPAWAGYPGPVEVLAGAGERPIMRESSSLVAAAHGRASQVVAGAAHDLPFTRPDLVAAAIHACSEASGPARP